jgi:hypothetical protein
LWKAGCDWAGFVRTYLWSSNRLAATACKTSTVDSTIDHVIAVTVRSSVQAYHVTECWDVSKKMSHFGDSLAFGKTVHDRNANIGVVAVGAAAISNTF